MSTTIDVATLDLIENALLNARFEMDEVVRRAAMSPTIRVQHDEFPMICNARGQMVVGQFGSYIPEVIDRFGGDYKSFDLKSSDGDDACKAACAADNKCRAWTYARPGYAGKEAHCFLKKDIKPPRRKAGYISGVVR